MRSLKVVADAGALARTAAEEFVLRARTAVEAKGLFTVTLAGGNTPRALYRLLAGGGEPPYRDRVPWDEVYFFVGDERHVPPDHTDSNYHMVQEELLSKVPVEPGHVWRFLSESSDIHAVSANYEEQLRSFFSLKPGEFPRFDLVLLGLGSDGHTASLFPRSQVLHERERLAASIWVDRLHSYRFTLTPPVFNNAASVVFLVSGSGKAEAVRDVLEGAHSPERLPAQAICPETGIVLWLMDREAARLLSSGVTRP